MVKITWGIEDGYAVPSRPQHTEVPDDELEGCETVEEAEKIIEEYIREDFENNIYTFWNRDQIDFEEYINKCEDEDD